MFPNDVVSLVMKLEWKILDNTFLFSRLEGIRTYPSALKLAEASEIDQVRANFS
jgi:hypothetical protein